MTPDQLLIKSLLFRNVHGFLVISNGKAMLVDTGYPGMTGQVFSALENSGLVLSDLALIILTHTHFDHAGGTQALQRETGAKVIVHEQEARYLARGRTPIPPGTRWKGKVISLLGKTFFRRIEKYPPATADRLVGVDLSLEAYGFPARILHTPGHTPGSISVILQNNKALVGDIMMGVSHKEHFPPFATHRKDVLNSWKKLLETGASTFYPAHGQPIQRKEIENELPEAILKYGHKG